MFSSVCFWRETSYLCEDRTFIYVKAGMKQHVPMLVPGNLCLWLCVFEKCKVVIRLQRMIGKENFENNSRSNLYSRHFFFCLIATSSLSRLPFWNCPGEQCWRLCEAKLPRDAWVYEKVQCTSHPGWSGVSKVSVNLFSPKSSQWKRSLATDVMFVGFFFLMLSKYTHCVFHNTSHHMRSRRQYGINVHLIIWPSFLVTSTVPSWQ